MTRATAGMAPPHVVDSYLAEVTARLPGPARARASVVDELRAGLLDAIDAYRSAGLAADQAAQTAVSEFGDPRQVAGAFRPELAISEARRVAITLVATGPLIGLLWAAAATASHLGIRHAPPWQWVGAPPVARFAKPLSPELYSDPHLMQRFLRHDDWLRVLARPGGGPERTARFMDRDHQADGITLRVTELTGQPGDVVLTHPWVLHSAAPNTGTYPRMMLTKNLYRQGIRRPWERGQDARANTLSHRDNTPA